MDSLRIGLIAHAVDCLENAGRILSPCTLLDDNDVRTLDPEILTRIDQICRSFATSYSTERIGELRKLVQELRLANQNEAVLARPEKGL